MFRAVWLLILAIPALAGESAVLSSGLRLHVDRHEEWGEVMRLYRGEAVTEMPKAFITAFEPDEAPPAPPPAPPVVTPPAVTPPVVTAPAITPPSVTDPRALARAAAARAGLPAAFVESVARTESGFDPGSVSPKGAIGVMQLMPA